MKKTLFIISLRYPLINAINIKLNELHDKQADIILDDTIRNDSYQLAENLRKSQIFDNVFFTNPDGYNGLKKFFQNFNITNSFIKACYGSYKNLKLRYLFKTNPEAYLNNIVLSGGTIDLSLYDDIYVCSQTKVSWICLNYLTKNNYIKEINLIEEGTSIYCKKDIICKYSSLYHCQKIKVNLYEPDLIGYNIDLKNVVLCKLPKISCQNTTFINNINLIFNYKNLQNFDNKIIFFEQVSEPMPNYFKYYLAKIFLYNSYKKHLKEHRLFLDKINIINNLIYIFNKHNLAEKFFLKLHPRTKNGYPNKLNRYIIGDIKNIHTIPWEVYCMNQQFKNNLWITMYSSSVLNLVLCFKDIYKIKFIFLYKCSKQFNNEIGNLQIFYNNFQKKYNNLIIIPKNIEEAEQQIKLFYSII